MTTGLGRETDADLEAAWERTLRSAGVPPSMRDEPEWLPRRLARLCHPWPRSPGAADRLGADLAGVLVEAQATAPAVIRDAVLLIGGTGMRPEIKARVQAALAAEHAHAVQERLLDQQEAIHRAAITARDRAEAALRESEARFRTLFGQAPVGIGIGDTDGRILEVNETLQRMFGYSLAEFRDRRVESFMVENDAEDIWRDYAALVAGDIDEFRTEKRYLHKDGHIVWTNLSVSLIRGADGRPVFQVAVMEDITEQHRLRERLRHEAGHDSLTGLPNRAFLLHRLDAALAAAQPEANVAVLFLDLDGFKFVNDSRGHQVGDRVLIAVAERLAAAAEREGAFLARLGGDEFVVLLSPPADRLAPLAEGLVQALQDPIHLDHQETVRVQASIGVVELAADDTTAAELLSAADLALHAAKAEGRGRVVQHDRSGTARQLTTFTIATDLPGVVERGELDLVYQPLVALRNGDLHGVEALLRWRHPQLGELSPDLFVPLAEENSAIIPIGRWVLDRACADLAAGGGPTVNINASVRQLYSPSFISDVQNALDRNALQPQQIRIEITESVFMQDGDPAPLRALHALADLGVRIVMDDFGTGYSNLAALSRLPIHELKLAGTFLRNSGPEDDLTILRTVVDLAHTLGLVVTVEGVETAEHDERVRAIGCDVGQGWFYAAATSALSPHRPAS